MNLAKSYSVSLIGLAGTMVEVEAEISSNLPAFVLVGLPDTSLLEAKDRVRAALANSGTAMPSRRVTVNLSPASVRKRGAGFDLAIAMAILAADKKIDPNSVAGCIHLGELALDGSIRAISGVLPAVLSAKQAGFGKVIVPMQNLSEASLVQSIEVLGASSLGQVAAHHGLGGASVRLPSIGEAAAPATSSEVLKTDLADVVGQDEAIEAITIAAAGGHHMLMVGPAGVGKTMLAERLAGLLPDLSDEQALECAAIASVLGKYDNGVKLSYRPPFEAPHHSASMSALIGGGMGVPQPGLVSLAHRGVLFLDEVPEFQRPALDSLRQPLESGEVTVNRSSGTARFPARFQLVMAANPCPCGNWGSKARSCRCKASVRHSYSAKLSGPLLDRIDIRLRLQAPTQVQSTLARLGATEMGRNTESVRALVEKARHRAAVRLTSSGYRLNSEIPGTMLRRRFRPSHAATLRLDRALDRGLISMRGYDRCLRLAWTCADLAGKETPDEHDLAKAFLLRGEDGNSAW
jgi:magnesium chelatase family protein